MIILSKVWLQSNLSELTQREPSQLIAYLGLNCVYVDEN